MTKATGWGIETDGSDSGLAEAITAANSLLRADETEGEEQTSLIVIPATELNYAADVDDWTVLVLYWYRASGTNRASTLYEETGRDWHALIERAVFRRLTA